MKKQLQIHNNLDELNKVAEFIETIGDELNLSPSLVMNINLALEEAVVNVISYAFLNQDGKSNIDLYAEFCDNTLVFTLTDKGLAFDPTTATTADITLSIEDRPVGGLGIFLIRQIMDEVSYKRIKEENQLSLKKKIIN